MTHRVKAALAKVIAFIAFLVLISPPIIFFIWYRSIQTPPFVMIDPPSVLTPLIDRGQELQTKWHIRKLRDCPTIVYRSIRHEETQSIWHITPKSWPPRQIDGDFQYTAYIEIPDDIPGGDYTLRTQLEFQCGIFKEIHTEMPILQFRVRS